MIRAIGICGSPRKNGNTEILLRRCLAQLQAAGIETELVPLADKAIKPCRACGVCRQRQDGACAMKDDEFHDVYARMLEADILVVGSPVYFGSATPDMMALLDRAGYVARANGNPLSRKIGGPIVVARRAGQNFTYAQLLYWFMINDMVVPGSTYWNIAFGREVGEVEKDAEGLQTIDRFAENLAWLARRLCGPAGA
jgi:multimeric flavodoxin WrbA